MFFIGKLEEYNIDSVEIIIHQNPAFHAKVVISHGVPAKGRRCNHVGILCHSAALAAVETLSGTTAGVYYGLSSNRNRVHEHCKSVLQP